MIKPMAEVAWRPYFERWDFTLIHHESGLFSQGSMVCGHGEKCKEAGLAAVKGMFNAAGIRDEDIRVEGESK